MRPAAIDLAPAPTDELGPTSNLFQSPLWARFRRELGTPVVTVDLGPPEAGMMVQLERQGDFELAYVAAGPDVGVDEGEAGRFLERLSGQLHAELPGDPVAVRYDLPWPSPFAADDERPSVRSREIRMNFGTAEHRLAKAPTDRLAPDTVQLDLAPGEGEILAAMRSKTRYNIRLAARRGVTVARVGPERLSEWHRLYVETAERKGFRPQALGYFTRLFELARGHRPEMRLYLAFGPRPDGRGGPDHRAETAIGRLSVSAAARPLAGIVVAHAGRAATYLYGASAADRRALMAPYALQWHAIREARASGCTTYDLFGVPPAPDRGHPMYGLYRFKTGFGGRLVHRRGAWDYVYDREAYEVFGAAEAGGRGYYV